MGQSTDHKEGKALVKAIYFTSKVLADGSHPFMLRITKDRVRKYVATGLSLQPKFWNDKYNGYREAIRRTYPEPNRERLINELSQWEKKYSSAAETLATADEVHDAKAVAIKAVESRNALRRVQLLTFIDELVAGMILAKQIGNSGIYKDLRNQLADYLKTEYGTADVPFERVTVAFCNRLEIFLRTRGNSEVTLSNRYRTLRAVLNRAIADGAAKSEYYPFVRNVAERHKFSVGKFDTSTIKRAITRDDIRKIEALEPVGSALGRYAVQKNAAEVERVQFAKSVFLFSFYCGGINFVDLAQLRWRNITNDDQGKQRLIYVRQKTGGKFSIRLLAPAAAIINHYKLYTYTGPNSYVFPILNVDNHQTSNQIKNRLHKVLGQVNSDLKTLGTSIGIGIPLTTYVARHSFATNLKRSGVTTGIISEAMGHKTEAITSIYLDSFESEKVDTAYENLL